MGALGGWEVLIVTTFTNNIEHLWHWGMPQIHLFMTQVNTSLLFHSSWSSQIDLQMICHGCEICKYHNNNIIMYSKLLGG